MDRRGTAIIFDAPEEQSNAWGYKVFDQNPSSSRNILNISIEREVRGWTRGSSSTLISFEDLKIYCWWLFLIVNGKYSECLLSENRFKPSVSEWIHNMIWKFLIREEISMLNIIGYIIAMHTRYNNAKKVFQQVQPQFQSIQSPASSCSHSL